MGIFEMLNDDDFYYNCCLLPRHDLRADRENYFLRKIVSKIGNFYSFFNKFQNMEK